MTTSISIPLWFFILLLVVLGWSLLHHIFLPSVRWFARKRVNRVLDEIGSLLDIEIKPFQLTKRQVLIDRLVFDPKVAEAIQEHAEESQIPREVAQAKVVHYAKEIVPSFNAYIYFRIGNWLAKKIARLFYRVRVSFEDEQSISSIDSKATVVFVMNHRSNMDYVLVSCLSADKAALSYAVGEWARVWPLQSLIKTTGAFFVRRNSKNKLYRKVLERYVHMATKEGVCQAVFIEGGLSTDGKLRSPKLGFLDYMLRGYNVEEDREIVFIPIGINYDRTLEDRSLLRKLDPQAARRSTLFVLRTTLAFLGHNLWLGVRNRWHRFGFGCVNFGIPISAKDYCEQQGIVFHKLPVEQRFQHVERLAQLLVNDIQQRIPILPVAIVATIFLQKPDAKLSLFELNGFIYRMIETLEAKRAHIAFPMKALDFTMASAIHMMKIRHLLIEEEGIYQMAPGAHTICAYYSNSIIHWFTDAPTTVSHESTLLNQEAV